MPARPGSDSVDPSLRATSRAVRRRDRMNRAIDATGSIAVVGALMATGVVAGAMQSSAAEATASDAAGAAQVQDQVKARKHKPVPQPTHTIYKIVRVTQSPVPGIQAQGVTSLSTSGQSTSGSSGSGSTQPAYKPTKAAKPAQPQPAQPKPAPKPKPSATSSGS